MNSGYDKAINLSAKYLKVCRVIKSGITLSKPANTVFIQACIFERLCDGLQSANVLMKLSKKDIDIENSLGLILRCACVDMLTMLYVTSIKDENELFQQTSKILFGNVSRDKKYINFLIDEKILPKEFRTIVNRRAEAFEEEFKQKFNKKLDEISTSQIHTKLRNAGLKQFSKIYDYFIYYSKYEHFSKTTYAIQRMDIKHRQRYVIGSNRQHFFLP